jgi:hypothetical protein
MSQINRLYKLFPLLVLFALVFAACNSGQAPKPTTAAPTTTAVAPQPTAVPPTIAPAAIPPTVAPTATPNTSKSASFNQFSFDYDLSLATDVAATLVPGFNDPSAPEFANYPDMTQFNFVGYKSINKYHKPVIEIYAVADYEKISEASKTIIANLKQLLIDQPANPDQNIPFLPIFNATEIFHAQVQYLKFNSGVGVRFVAQYDQAFLPVNNMEIIYTFQCTSNEKNPSTLLRAWFDAPLWMLSSSTEY